MSTVDLRPHLKWALQRISTSLGEGEHYAAAERALNAANSAPQCLHQIQEPAPVLAEQHPDDAAVDALATLMKAKLAKQRAKGYGGWDTDCTRERLSELLRGHVDKGDPVDVANFCAFLTARGEGIAPQAAPAAMAVPDERTAFEAFAREYGTWDVERDDVQSIGIASYTDVAVVVAWHAWQARAALAATPAADIGNPIAGTAAPVIPNGWVPCVVTYEGQHPEEVAYGPQIMMDRLKKWLERYFEQQVAAPVVLPEPAAWIRKTDITELTELTDSEPETDGWTPLFTEQQVRALLAGVSAPAALAVPVLYVSKGQLDHHRDPDGPDSLNAGRYLPARITPAGKFTTPLFAAPQAQADARDAAITWPKARDVGRIGDMSPSAHMRVGFDSDNDVCVSVWDENGGGSIEFCNPGGGGGGQSSRTRMALIALMLAMEADNADKPSRDWWAQRASQAAQQGGNKQ